MADSFEKALESVRKGNTKNTKLDKSLSTKILGGKSENMLSAIKTAA